jgi:hypothetical protein
MGQTLLAAVASGLALAGALAVAGIGAGRFVRATPAFGLPALGAAGAVLAGRLGALPTAPALVLVTVTGAVAGVLGFALDRRVRTLDAPVWPPALLPEVAVLALGLGLAAVARPLTAIELPLGPLGGLASTSGAVVACGVGIVLAFGVGALPVGDRRRVLGWAASAAATAVVVAVGSGAVAVRGEALVPAFGIPDVAGLALRAAAVGVLARHRAAYAVAAALVLGVGESILRSQLSTGEAALIPTLAILAWSVWRSRDEPAAVPA